MEDHEWVTRVGMLIESPRKENPCAKVHIASPELRETLASDSDVLDVFRLLFREILDGRNLVGEREADDICARRIERDRSRRGVQVPRFTRELLPFPLVGRKL